MSLRERPGTVVQPRGGNRPIPHLPGRQPAHLASAQKITIGADLDITEIPHESGAIRFRCARVMPSDRRRWIRHGLFVEHHENGTLRSKGQYVDGKEDGPWRDFHPNGQAAAEGDYRDGKDVGVWRFWSLDGTEGPSSKFN